MDESISNCTSQSRIIASPTELALVASDRACSRALAITAGCVFTLASGLTNFLYALGKTHDLGQQILWCSVALAASLSLAIAPSALIDSANRKSASGLLLSMVAIALFGAYSLSGALGSAIGNRLDSEAIEVASSGNKERAQRAYDLAEQELATQASRKGKQALQRRTELVGTMDRLRLEIAAYGSPRASNSDSRALATYLSLAGLEVSPSDLNKWLALLAVLLVEFGGGLSFALASCLTRTTPSTLTSKPTTTPPVQVKEAAEPNKQVLKTPNTQEALLDLVSSNGQELWGSNRTFGKVLGVSHTQAGNIVKSLASSGKLKVSKGKQGTVLRLAN